MSIEYKQIDGVLLDKILAQCSDIEDKEMIKNHIHLENGSYSLAALHEDMPVGFISTYTLNFPIPLEGSKDAYIDIIDVDEKYRRKGIARELLERTEKWAQAYGFSQIRSWSSQDKVEAIPMWYSLQYCMCPAKIWVEWCKEVVNGYYVVKKLNPS